MIPYDSSPESLTLANSTLVRLTTERLGQAGFDPESMLREAGLTSEIPHDSDVRESVDSQIRFLHTAADALHDESLGLHLAQDYDLRRLGLFFYLMASSETVGEALTCFERFGRRDDPSLSGSWRVSDIALTVAIGYAGDERLLDRHLSEFWILSIYRLVWSLASTMARPIGVSFAHTKIGEADEIEGYFEVPVEFGASEDRIDFDVQLADVRLTTFDPYLHAYLVRHFENVLEATRWEPAVLWSRVKKAMAPRLSHGTVTTANIAKDLGMSTRTLSRRLSQEGKTFSAILDELRAELAIHYIRIKGLPISEIAWHLGYREASAVVVAFRRWMGMSPTEVRRRHETNPTSLGTMSQQDPADGHVD